jgi:Protein of unknown function (DUF2721)
MGGLFDIIPDATRLAGIFSQAAAPAFLLAGIAAFVTVVLTRLNTLVERMRAVGYLDPALPTAAVQKATLPALKARAVLLQGAAHLGLLAAIATTLLLLVMVLSAFLQSRHAFGALPLFGVAAIMLGIALHRFAKEIRLARQEIDAF